jgi:hypothetical protein
MSNRKSEQRSKLGQLLDERDLKLKDFAEMVYNETGYIIATTNLSNYCTGLKPIKSIYIAKHFADTLQVPITDIIE